jgi:hypothetical protein
MLKLEAIFSTVTNDNSKEKAEELFKFYNEFVLEELKNTHNKIINNRLNEELNDNKISVYE